MKPPTDPHLRRVWLRSMLFNLILTVNDTVWTIDNSWSVEGWSS